MIRKAFVMQLKPGFEAEYQRRHQPIWPDLIDVLRSHGASNYSIFIDSASLRLFGYVEIEDESRWAAIAETPICRRWWAHMQELMDTHPDGSPVSLPLHEVFHLD